jgi:hypothetical protein
VSASRVRSRTPVAGSQIRTVASSPAEASSSPRSTRTAHTSSTHLVCPGGQQSAAVDFLEVAVGKLVSSFIFFTFFVVYAEMPFGVLGVAALLDQFVLLPGRGLVFAPRTSVIGDVLVYSDQALAWSNALLFDLTVMALRPVPSGWSVAVFTTRC